jgi:hypothetical protein
MSTPLNFLQASVRADELVANQKMGIGVSGQSSELHIKASAPEIRLEDKVGAEASETATRIYADSGNTYIQSGVDFADGSSSNIVFGSMGNETEFVNIGAHGIETTGNLFVNNLQFTQTQGLDQILNVSNTTSNIMTLTNTSDDALNVAGGMTLGSNLAVSGSKFTYDNTNTTIFTGTNRSVVASEIGYLDMSTSSSSNNIRVKIFIQYTQSGSQGEAEYSYYIRPNSANTSSIYDYINKGGPITPVVYRTDASELWTGGTLGVVRFGYSITTAQFVNWRVEVTQRSNNVTFYPTNTGLAVDGTGLVQVTPAPSTNFNSNLAVNTNTLFVDTTTGNVGIGTTDPGTKLHLHNSSSSTSHQMLSIENPYVFGFNTGQDIGSSIVYRSRWQGDGLSDPVDMCTIEGRKEADANYGDSYIAFKTRYETDRNNGGAGTLSEKMRISGDGNVGIGTTNPQARFHVKPVNTTADSENTLLDFRGDFGIHGFLGIYATETHTNAIGPDLRFKGAVYNGTSSPTINQVMCLKPTGNVGIGSASPEYPLSFTRAGFAVNVSVVNPMSTAGIGAFNFGDLHVGDNVVTECICIYNPTAENSYGYKCGYVQWIQMKVRGQGIQDTIQIIKSYSADSSTVTVTAGTGSASHNTILTVSNGVADISYTARVFYRALDTP